MPDLDASVGVRLISYQDRLTLSILRNLGDAGACFGDKMQRLVAILTVFILFCYGLISCGDQENGYELPYDYSFSFANSAGNFTHNIPTNLAPGERFVATVTVENTGTTSPADDWAANDYQLRSLNNPLLAWGWINDTITSAVTAGNTATFSLILTAPTTESASTTFLAQMFTSGSYFGSQLSITGINVSSGNSPLYGCTASDISNLPTTMTIGESQLVSVTVQNSGTETWNSSTECLYHTHDTFGEWGSGSTGCENFSGTVAQGETATFNVALTAPSTPGSYNYKMGMISSGTSGTYSGMGFFSTTSDCIDHAITVQNGTLAYDATIASHNFPTTMTPGEVKVIDVVVNNTGSATWSSSANDIFFYSLNDPIGVWGVTNVSVGTDTANGEQRTFTMKITAPTTVGSYNHRWQMRKNSSPGAGQFGSEVNVAVTVVAAGCGNSVVDSGETCDDGNTTAGDGCSASCLVENQSRDLSSTTPGRQFVPVVIANAIYSGSDVSGDGIDDLIVVDYQGTSAAGSPSRSAAGTVWGYAGSSGFFTNASTGFAASATFSIIGDVNDNLGNSPIYTGNLIPGGTGEDLVISTTHGDGVSNARSGAGEVYVISTTVLSGRIDLTASPSGVTRIIGPNSYSDIRGGIRAIGAGDVNGDGYDDLFIGEPLADPSGRTNAGTVYVLAGGSSLTGDIDLSTVTSPLLIATIHGAHPEASFSGSLLGLGPAVVGNFYFASGNDVAIASPTASESLRHQGEVYTFAYPLSGTYDLSAGNYTARYQGTDAHALLGTSLHAGQISGASSSVDDLAIGGAQIPLSGTQRGAVFILEGSVQTGNVSIGSSNFSSIVKTIYYGAAYDDRFGVSMVAGDVNGDGYDDLFVGSPNADNGGTSNTGAAYMFISPGANTPPSSRDMSTGHADFEIYGGATNEALGRRNQLLATGDLNNDGRDDLCVIRRGGNVACFPSIW